MPQCEYALEHAALGYKDSRDLHRRRRWRQQAHPEVAMPLAFALMLKKPRDIIVFGGHLDLRANSQPQIGLTMLVTSPTLSSRAHRARVQR
jgi:hypothetical protein